MSSVSICLAVRKTSYSQEYKRVILSFVTQRSRIYTLMIHRTETQTISIGLARQNNTSTLEPGIERKGKVINKSIMKNIRFGLLAIFGYYLGCLLLPTLANAQVNITTTDKKYITQAAKDTLQKFQDKTIDSILPDYICSSLKQYRELLKQATKIDELNDTEIKKLADECEKIFNDLYNAIQKKKINEEKTGRRGSMDDCLINCESTHSRRIKQTDPHDWFERFNCNLDASSCVIGCYVNAANNASRKGGIPKD